LDAANPLEVREKYPHTYKDDSTRHLLLAEGKVVEMPKPMVI
jgi:hypothetical protein